MSHGPRMVRTGVSTSFSPQPPPPPPPPPHGGPGPEAAGLVDVGYARSCAAGLKLAQMNHRVERDLKGHLVQSPA